MIKADMNYTHEDMREYCRYVRSSKGILGFYGALFAVYTGAVIAFIISGTETYALVSLVAVQAVIAALFVILVLTVVRTAAMKELEKAVEKFKGKPITFEFGTSEFSAYTGTGKDDYSLTCSYEDVSRVVETKDYFFIVTDDGDDFVIRKSAITQGSPVELAEILKTGTDRRYKNKTK